MLGVPVWVWKQRTISGAFPFLRCSHPPPLPAVCLSLSLFQDRFLTGLKFTTQLIPGRLTRNVQGSSCVL